MVLSPDREWVLARRSLTCGVIYMLPTGVGEPRQIPIEGLQGHSAVWLPVGTRIVLAASEPVQGTPLYRPDPETGEHTLWRDLTPPDPTGIYRIGRLRISADGDAYAYTYYLHLIDLHVIEGLR